MYIDKKTSIDIKSVKEFLEFWEKFHSLYNDTLSKGIISKEDETKFLETKVMIMSKYDDLKGGLDFKYVPHGRLTDPVGEILSVGSVRFASEKNLKKLGDDWRDSYIFLNNILERLENRKRRLGQFSAVGVFMKRILRKK